MSSLSSISSESGKCDSESNTCDDINRHHAVDTDGQLRLNIEGSLFLPFSASEPGFLLHLRGRTHSGVTPGRGTTKPPIVTEDGKGFWLLAPLMLRISSHSFKINGLYSQTGRTFQCPIARTNSTFASTSHTSPATMQSTRPVAYLSSHRSLCGYPWSASTSADCFFI